MVSFHTPLSPTGRNLVPEFENPSNKRKWEESQAEGISDEKHPLRAKNMESIFDTELHLQAPLPLEWQRCLDIKSGQIYFYNTRTLKRTSSDPRIGQEPPSPDHMSLDLELNLPCGHNSSSNSNHSGENHHHVNSSRDDKSSTEQGGGLTRSPSWLGFEGGDQQQQEMVTSVCKKCHMLVMMFKSSPTCPNCKFTHPPDQTPANLFNPRLSLLC